MRALFLGLLLLLPVHADEVILKGGTRLSGTVLIRDDHGLRLLTPEGTEIRVAAADISTVVKSQDAPQSGEWIRFKKGKKYGGDLQVALVHFLAPGTGRRVDLLSAVHIADPEYWTDVRRHLETAEVVLFELRSRPISEPNAAGQVTADQYRQDQAVFNPSFGQRSQVRRELLLGQQQGFTA